MNNRSAVQQSMPSNAGSSRGSTNEGRKR